MIECRITKVDDQTDGTHVAELAFYDDSDPEKEVGHRKKLECDNTARFESALNAKLDRIQSLHGDKITVQSDAEAALARVLAARRGGG